MGLVAALGTAAVDDDELRRIVGLLLSTDPASIEVHDVTVTPVEYDIPAITTAGRWWVGGSAVSVRDARDFHLFVKHIQSWSRSPMFADVPLDYRDVAEAMVPWRTEALVYRSDLVDHLPQGLRMPRALAIHDLDPKSASVWLEAVEVVPCAWTPDDYREAGYLLARLNANAATAARSAVGESDLRRSPRTYVDGRLAVAIAPVLLGDDVWRHPLIAPAFDAALRADLRAAVSDAQRYVDELDRVPLGAAHGDACPNNLLRTSEPGFTLIDFGFWSTQPLGFDLAQLVLGEVQLGRTLSETIPAIEAAALRGYVEGLRAEGCSLPAVDVRRAYLLKALIYTGLSALPFEFLDQPVTPALQRVAEERAALARYLLDAVSSTEPV